MFRVDRLIPVAIVLSAGISLSACSSSSNFDPTDWITGDFFEKPKLPGERKAVFPDGVPGVPQGVPAELVKGNQQAAVEVAPEPPPVVKPAPPARPQATRPAPKPRTASAPPQQPAPARSAPPPQPQQPASQPAAAAAWPEPNAVPARPAARTAAPASAAPTTNSQVNWPPPDPNSFSR